VQVAAVKAYDPVAMLNRKIVAMQLKCRDMYDAMIDTCIDLAMNGLNSESQFQPAYPIMREKWFFDGRNIYIRWSKKNGLHIMELDRRYGFNMNGSL